jgi:hypothetical protein
MCVGQLFGCSTFYPLNPHHPRHPLSEQILKPRVGFKGLTNRACEVFDKARGECLEYKIEERLLEDAEFRNTANMLGFICLIGGRRFKICEDKPGFCRHTYKRNCFLGICGKRDKLEEYIPVERYQFLLDANTRCFDKDMLSIYDPN